MLPNDETHRPWCGTHGVTLHSGRCDCPVPDTAQEKTIAGLCNCGAGFVKLLPHDATCPKSRPAPDAPSRNVKVECAACKTPYVSSDPLKDTRCPVCGGHVFTRIDAAPRVVAETWTCLDCGPFIKRFIEAAGVIDLAPPRRIKDGLLLLDAQGAEQCRAAGHDVRPAEEVKREG